jgi:hypothetical protein
MMKPAGTGISDRAPATRFLKLLVIPPLALGILAGVAGGVAVGAGPTSAAPMTTAGVTPSSTSVTAWDAATNSMWSGTETTGASVFAKSDVTPLVPLPTGTVTYTLFNNGTDGADGGPALCTGTMITAGTVTLNADGSVPQSATLGPLAGAVYGIEASYSGDSTYQASSGCFPVGVLPTTSTTASVVTDASTNQPWNNQETTGASAYDTATVTGVTGVTPTGKVTYNVFTNGSCSGAATTVNVQILNPDGSVPNSATTAHLAPGSYSADAVYSGDNSYDTSTSTCEGFNVAKAAGSTSVVDDATTTHPWTGTEIQGTAAFDTVTVPSAPGFTPTGTVTYRMFANTACTGSAKSLQQVVLSDGKVPPSRSTGPLPSGGFSFETLYSGDANYKLFTGACERFSVLSAGYRLEGGDGGVFNFHVPSYGSAPHVAHRVFSFVGIADTSKGYWLVQANGAISTFGNAHNYGSLPAEGESAQDIVGIAATPDGRGYWMVGSDGTVYRFGDAVSHGTLASRGVHVHNVVSIVSPDLGGYWLVLANGTVYSFGDARYHGACPQAGSGCKGSAIVAMANAGGTGYWLVSKDGRVFGFGAAHTHGSCGQTGSGCRGATDVVGIASPDAGGYWLVEADGNVAAFGDAKLFGDEAGKNIQGSITAISG